MIKLIITCDIRAGKETQFLEFINHDFAEVMPSIGLQPSEAWYAPWTQGPRAILCGLVENEQSLGRILASGEWAQMHARIQEFGVDITYKRSDRESGFQI